MLPRPENQLLIDEIFALVMSDRFLTGLHPYLEDGVLLVDDPEEAMHWSLEAEAELPWLDVRNLESAEITGLIYKLPNYREVSAAIMAEQEKLWALIGERIPEDMRFCLDDACANLGACLESRALLAEPHPLYEAIFRIYNNGGWPCGWDGEYPEGRMVVFTARRGSSEP